MVAVRHARLGKYLVVESLSERVTDNAWSTQYLNLSSVAEQIPLVKDRSAFLTYYTADEPDGWLVRPAFTFGYSYFDLY